MFKKMYKLKIRAKLVLTTLIILTVALVSVSSVSYFVFKDRLQDKIMQSLGTITVDRAEFVKSWLSKLEYISVVNFVTNNDNDSVDIADLHLSKIDSTILTSFIFFNDGNLIDANGWKPDPGTDLKQMNWYKVGISSNKPTYLLDRDLKTNNVSVFCVRQFTDKNGNVKGVIAQIYDSNVFNTMVASLRAEGDGYGYIVGKGHILAHPDKSLVGKTVEDAGVAIANELVANLGTPIHYEFRNVKKYGVAVKIPDMQDAYLIMAVPDETVLKPLDNVDLYMIGISLLFLLLASITFSIMSTRISNPLVKSSELLGHIALGDFTRDTDSADLNIPDEIGDINRSVDKVKKSLIGIIKELKSSSNILSHDAQSLSATATQRTSGLQQISVSCNEMAAGIQVLADNNQESVASLTDLSSLLDKANEISSGMVDRVVIAQQKSNIGLSVMKELMDDNLVVNAAVGNMNTTVADIYEKSNKIKDILEIINNISGQTNLLALNALIEDAKIKENNGFSVIANEIKKLSDHTKLESANISSKLSEITVGIEKLVEYSSKFDITMKEQTGTINLSNESFKNISDSIDEVIQLTNKLKDIVINIDANKVTVLSMVENNASLTEEFSANIQEITASVEQNLAGSEENLNTIKKLDKLSNGLLAIVEKFKI